MKKILVIDDEAPIRENIQEYLENLDFIVITASNGATGIQSAISETPDIIICDIDMPDINGYKVLETLQGIKTTSTIPFVFLSAKTQAEEITQGLELGVDDYITKPFRFKNLLSRIHKRLDKHDLIIGNTESKFIALSETPLLGIVILIDGKIQFINSKFGTMLQTSNEKLKDTPFIHLLHETNRNQFEGKIELLIGHPNAKAEMTVVFEQINLTEAKIYAKSINTAGQEAVLLTIQELNQQEHTTSTIEENKIEELLCLLQEEGKHDLAQNLKNLIDKVKSNNKEVGNISLTKREIEVLTQICLGFTASEIGNLLFISQRTVDGHRNNLLSKTGAKNTATLVAFAIKHNLVEI